MSTDLIVVEVKKELVQTVFTEYDNLKPILAEIAQKAKSIVPDTSTAKGRKEIASIAYQVAQSKTYLDGLGKDLVSDMKKLPSIVDGSRKQMREFLDALRDEVRKPLTDWEAEQERIEAERKAEIAARELAKQIESDHEIGLLMNREFDRVAAEKKALLEQAQKELEERIAREATERAEAAAKEALQRAERERAEAEQRAKDAEAKALRAKAEAEQQEKDRQAHALRVQQQEEARRNANTEHKARINRVALSDLMLIVCDEQMAKRIVIAIATGEISNVSIKY